MAMPVAMLVGCARRNAIWTMRWLARGDGWWGATVARCAGGADDRFAGDLIADAADVMASVGMLRRSGVDVLAELVFAETPSKDNSMRGSMRGNGLLTELATIHFPRFFSRPRATELLGGYAASPSDAA